MQYFHVLLNSIFFSAIICVVESDFIKNSAFKEILLKNNFSGSLKQNENLSKHCTMHVGGNAGLFLEPFDTLSLVLALKAARKLNLSFFLLGGGSNTIFPDEGLNLVISTRKLNAAEGIKLTGGNKISCPAGAAWGSVLSFCKKNNLGGFEPFTSLSGTVGGALFMNATCFGLSACDNLLSAEYLDLDFDSIEIKKYEKKLCDWGYKKSPFKQDGGVVGVSPAEGVAQNARCAVGARGRLPPFQQKIILSAEFCVKNGFDENLSETVKQKRIQMGHFKAASAGSAFKNVPEKNIIAGKLIDECGLKGFCIGGAQIAPWHANFIINPDGKATAADIRALVEAVQKKVLEEKGILLEPEIIFL